MKESYGTLSETINALKREGYTFDFNVREDCLVCKQNNAVLPPDEFEIDKVFRFEGESNPDGAAVLYAISSPAHKLKGVLVNGYGISANAASAAMVQKLRTHNGA